MHLLNLEKKQMTQALFDLAQEKKKNQQMKRKYLFWKQLIRDCVNSQYGWKNV